MAPATPRSPHRHEARPMSCAPFGITLRASALQKSAGPCQACHGGWLQALKKLAKPLKTDAFLEVARDMQSPFSLLPSCCRLTRRATEFPAPPLGNTTMLKKLTLATAAAIAVTASSFAVAETLSSPVGDFDVSMNVGLTSDYIFRGISQTQGNGAIQGGLDVAHENGLYIGTWASNVDFGGDASVEFNYYLGFGNDITENISYDLGWIKYDYPGESALNFSEYYGSLSAYGLTVGAAYSDDFGGSDTTLYSYVYYEYALPYDVGLALQYGKYDFKDATFGNDDSYNDWSIGLSKTLVGLDFGLTYSDTSLSGSECAGFVGKDDYCDATLVVSVSKTL